MNDAISTHILTKRMTWYAHEFPSYIIFQLTSSRRGWRTSHSFARLMTYFNSHPHEEDDTDVEFSDKNGNISTHILTKRMTLRPTLPQFTLVFQLTSSRRGWPSQFHKLHGMRHISTHILTKRMTHSPLLPEYGSCISTHILTKRMTKSWSQ